MIQQCEIMVLKLKKKAKGGQTTVYDIHCNTCNERIFVYQKDGKGNILRCYLDRILYPENLASLSEKKILKANEIPNLHCNSCNTLIATPRKRDNGRIAFRMIPGYFHKTFTKMKVK